MYIGACHMPWQPLQNHPSGHLGRWATPWSAEEMLDGQLQTVDTLPMPELLTMLSCRKDLNMISAESSLMSPRQPSRSRDWTELTGKIKSTEVESSMRLVSDNVTLCLLVCQGGIVVIVGDSSLRYCVPCSKCMPIVLLLRFVCWYYTSALAIILFHN